MTYKEIKNSITLLGNRCDGKCEVSKELSKKYCYPLFDIEEFITFIDYEFYGILNGDEQKQQRFIKKSFEECRVACGNNSYDFQKNIKDMVVEFVEKYRFYRSYFGGLSRFYDSYIKYCDRQNKSNKPTERLANMYLLTSEILEKIMDYSFQPIVVSLPAVVGWEFSDSDRAIINRRMADIYKLEDFKKAQDLFQKLIKRSKTVLMIPTKELAESGEINLSRDEQYILSSSEAYVEEIPISMSTSKNFNFEANDCFKNHDWSNAKSFINHKMSNSKNEIKNVTDEITEMLDNYSDYKKIKKMYEKTV